MVLCTSIMIASIKGIFADLLERFSKQLVQKHSSYLLYEPFVYDIHRRLPRATVLTRTSVEFLHYLKRDSLHLEMSLCVLVQYP
jgi:hypothetical protein